MSVGSDGGAAVANNVANRTAQNGAHAQIPSHGMNFIMSLFWDSLLTSAGLSYF